MLETSPSSGEPDQPRRCFHFQRRRSKLPNGARNRNTNRGFRSQVSLKKRQISRRHRRWKNRRAYREFKTCCKKFIWPKKAPESRLRQHRFWHAKVMSAMPGRNARKSQFHQFKNPERADKPRTSPHLRYNQPLKVATLNVRGLVGENAYLKKAQVVNIMTKFEYDLMLLQETNKNTNSVETIKGFEFFF